MAKRRANGEGTFYRDGAYYAWKVKIDGRYVVKKAKTQAELKVKIREVQVMMDIDSKVLTGPKVMFGDAVRRYALATYGDIAKPRTWKYEENTVMQNVKICARLAEMFPKLALDSFSISHVAKLLAAHDGRPAAARRIVNHALAALPAAKRMIIKEQMKDAHVRIPKGNGAKERTLTPVEAAMLRKHLIHTEERPYRWLFLLLMNSGLRINEALGLTEDKYDVAGSKILIDSQMTPSGKVKKGTKNKKVRIVPLNRDATLAIEEALRLKRLNKEKAGSFWKETGLIFCNEVGEAVRSTSMNVAFKSVAKRAGIDTTGLSQHVLRAVYATALAQALPEGQLKRGSQILGNSPEVFATTYIRVAGLQDTDAIRDIEIGVE